MTLKYAQAAVHWFTCHWHRGPQVHISPTARHLPVPAPDDARGMCWKGEVHLVAAQPVDSLAQTLAHEAVGHFGLRQLLGAAWPHFMTHLQDGVRAGDPSLTRLRNHIRQAYADDSGLYSLTCRQEADEIAAYVAEDMVCMQTGAIRPAKPWAQALEAAAGRLLREGLCLDRAVSRSELEGTLFLAAKHLEGWPWHPIRRQVCRAWGRWRTMLGMADHPKPLMSHEESKRLLKAEADRLRAKEESEGFWRISRGLLAFVVLFFGGIGLLILAIARAFF